MKYNTATLDNGLRVIHMPAPGHQVAYCGFAIAAGTRHELPGEEGLAHFVEHTTFKGTEKRSAFQILPAGIQQQEAVRTDLRRIPSIMLPSCATM